MGDSPNRPDSERWARIESIFEGAIALPPDERREFLAQACAGDASLRASVQRLLAADSKIGGPLDTPLGFLSEGLFETRHGEDQSTDSPDSTGEQPPPLPDGTRVGPYRIVEAIGSGGMGAVYRAERVEGGYEQEVALKVVRGSWIAAELERRFLQERQILARLEHPGIARLVDGGLTAEGSPYLAMELVSGDPITTWMERHGLDVATRLRVFLEVCDAVQYAHQNLVLHRDLKPANILVTPEGRARLLDFGIARVLETNADDGNPEALTRAGTLLLTPEYAAPEQLIGEPTSTTTDVYALGAILYELLSGRRAFVIASRSWSEIGRILREDPPPLSRASGLDRKLRRHLEGDLENIVFQAMRKEPSQRYASVEALAEDIRRHLEGLPVSARPATLRYRLGKYVRRHRVGVLATSGVIVAGLMGTGTTIRQAQATRIEAARAEAVRDFLFGLFEAADPSQNLGEIPDARELLDRGAARIDSLGTDVGPEIQVDLLTTLGLLYGKLGLFPESRSLLQRAVAEGENELGHEARTALAWDALAANWIEEGQLDSAWTAATTGLEIRREIGAADTLLGESYSTLGTIAHSSGRLDESVAHHRRALALDRGAFTGDHQRIVTDLNNLSLSLQDTDALDESVELSEEAVAMSRRLYDGPHPEVAYALGALATAVGSDGDLVRAGELQHEALIINRTVFGGSHPEVARTLDQMALWIDRQGQHQSADSLHREALAIRVETLGPDHADVAATLTNLAVSRYRRADYAGAAAMQEQALGIWIRTYGEDHHRTAIAINNLGAMQLRAGDLDGADHNLARSYAIRQRLFPDGGEDIGAAQRNLGDLRRAQMRPLEAIALYEQARGSLEAVLGADHWRIADTEFGRGAALVELDRFDASIEPLRNALRIRSETFVEDDIRVDEVRLWLGIALVESGEVDEARLLLERAEAGFEAARGSEDEATIRARSALDRLGR